MSLPRMTVSLPRAGVDFEAGDRRRFAEQSFGALFRVRADVAADFERRAEAIT